MGQLRITGGRFRGRRVRSAPGSRPTLERVREALLSRWQERLVGATLLELFCGGGVVGLEALSRGAAWVVFVDRSQSALRVLSTNCQRLGLPRPETLRRDLSGNLDSLLPGRVFDLVFADPPYAVGGLERLLVGAGRLLAGDGEMAVEHGGRSAPPEVAGDLVQVDRRRYGESGLAFYRHRRESLEEKNPLDGDTPAPGAGGAR